MAATASASGVVMDMDMVQDVMCEYRQYIP